MDASKFSDTMTMTAAVVIGGTLAGTGKLRSYVGDELRGDQANPSSPPFGAYKGKSLYQITMYANMGGETVRFTFEDSSGTLTNLDTTITFAINGNLGGIPAPHILTD